MKAIVLGCPFDNGIRSMLALRRGITGACDGPKAIFEIFEKDYLPGYGKSVITKMLPLENFNLPVSLQNIREEPFRKKQIESTLEAQRLITTQIHSCAGEGFICASVGGDHSLSYPLCKGICEAHPGKRAGVIYIDAHFDMRPLEEDGPLSGILSSGNSFYRLIEDPEIPLSGENVAVLGIYDSGTSIFEQLKKYAFEKKVHVIYDHQIEPVDKIVQKALEVVAKETDFIYFSVDIDCLKEEFAPGVSAPAVKGLEENQLYEMVKKISAHPKVVAMDVVETSSRQIAWYELMEGRSRQESLAERQRKLMETARRSAKVVDLFLKEKKHVPSGAIP